LHTDQARPVKLAGHIRGECSVENIGIDSFGYDCPFCGELYTPLTFNRLKHVG
jgi:inosine/xanthosine triphosphate pyrophosphatase family protein